MKQAPMKWPHHPPSTKEAYFFRQIFAETFGEDRQNIIPKYWLPKWDKKGTEIKEYVDPSARTLEVYSDA